MKFRAISALLLSATVLTLTGCIAGFTYTAGSAGPGHLYIECDSCTQYHGTTSQIVAYSKDADGTPTATSTITAQSSNTNFSGMKVDAAGNLYTTAYDNDNEIYSILVYAPVASGNSTAPPARIITNSSGLMESLDSFAVAPDGTIYFVDDEYGLLRFPAGSHGDVTPTVFPDLFFGSMATDKNGNLFALDFANNVDIYNAGFTSETATRTFTSTVSIYNYFIAVDSTDNIYISGYDPNAQQNLIEVFAAGDSGSVSPVRTIAGSNTNLNGTDSIAVDGQGDLYVRTFDEAAFSAVHTPGAHAVQHIQPLEILPKVEILEFSPTASGNQAPIASYDTGLYIEDSYDIALY